MNQFQDNGGTLAFTRNNLGINVNGDAEGATFIDIDYDGDLDLYINLNNRVNQLWINNLNTLAAGDDYLKVIVKDDRDSTGVFGFHGGRLGLGSTVRLLDCQGNRISGIKEMNGGYGHGTQGAPEIHFGLPDGPDEEIIVLVKYPRIDGTRLVAAGRVTPSSLTNQTLTISPSSWAPFFNDEPVAENDSAYYFGGIESLDIEVFGNDFDPDLDNFSIQSIIPGTDIDAEIDIIDATSTTQSFRPFPVRKPLGR